MKKDLNYLNEKWWYRLVKVVFVLVIIFVLFDVNFSFFQNRGLVTVSSKTKVYCNVKDMKQFTLKDIDISIEKRFFNKSNIFDYKSYFESYNDFDIAKILKECTGTDISSDRIGMYQKILEIAKEKGDGQEFSEADAYIIDKASQAYVFDRDKYLNYDYRLFDIRPIMNVSRRLLIFLLINLGVLAGFEVLKRIFYYVFLGDFFADKLGKKLIAYLKASLIKDYKNEN